MGEIVGVREQEAWAQTVGDKWHFCEGVSPNAAPRVAICAHVTVFETVIMLRVTVTLCLRLRGSHLVPPSSLSSQSPPHQSKHPGQEGTGDRDEEIRIRLLRGTFISTAR